jgi:hypothetical protein
VSNAGVFRTSELPMGEDGGVIVDVPSVMSYSVRAGVTSG